MFTLLALSLSILALSLSTLYKTFPKFLTTFALSTGESSTTGQTTTSAPPTAQEPPPAILIPKIHPLEPQVTAEVEAYFIEHWPFPNGKAVQKFRDAGFSYVTCCYYPEALPDRIHFACRLLTLLFLIDGMTLPSSPNSTTHQATDILEHMSFESGKAYNEKLMPIARGDVLPDRNVPVEYITYDLWEMMRACDRKLADEILDPVFTFMRAQTDPSRKGNFGLGSYLQYREGDVGKASVGPRP